MLTEPFAPVTTALTSATEALLVLAANEGFEVRHPYRAYRGVEEFCLERSDFYGLVEVGTRTGKVLRVSVRNGRTNELVGKVTGTLAGRRLIASIGAGEWS